MRVTLRPARILPLAQGETLRLALVAVLAFGVLARPSEGTDARLAQQPRATAVFAGGCFWCMEPPFDDLPGVVSTTSGYTGGRVPNPTYQHVSNGNTGHTEAIEVVYDPSKITYQQLLEVFWRNVDAVDAGGQFCDRGSQYRSGIFYGSAEEQRLAEASKQQIAQRLKQPVATEVTKLGAFYRAEDYHQDYYKKNPVRYKFYTFNCGRARRLERLWGKSPSS